MIPQNGCTLNWVQPFLLDFFSQCRIALAVAGERDFLTVPFF